MSSFFIAGREIGPHHKPFIIAEMSGNHNQSLDRALALVDAAAAAGVDAIKLQTYTADTLTIDVKDGLFFIEDKNSLWKGESLYDLYKKAYTPWEWHKPIFDRAKEKGIICFSSPFDVTAVDFLETLNAPAYKVASFENTDWEILRKVAQTGKPVIMSTGVSTLSDIAESVQVLWDAGCKNLVLLKCTSTYPATPENTNLLTIPHLAQMFGCMAGLSDHTMGVGVPVAAVALGARVIEKHFTLSRAEGGVDAAFSLEPEEFKQLVIESERAFQAMGTVHYGILPAEQKSLQFKRSLYIVRDMKAGEKFTPENVRSIRPGAGLAPKHLAVVLNKTAKTDLKKGTPLAWEHIG